MKTKLFFTLAVLIYALVACSPQQAPTPTPLPPTEQTGEIITVGDISDKPSEIIETHQPLADYLGKNLSEFGIIAGEVKVAPDIDTMAQWVKSGDVDLYFDSPYPALIVSSNSGGEPILRRWKGGVGEYSSIIFTLADDNIETLEDLKGSMIAFDEPYSTSGYMLPLAYLLEADLNAVEKPDTNAQVADDEVGYVFSGDDENAVQWVISKRVGAAVVDSNTFSEIPEETREQLRVLAETEALPRHIVVVSPTVKPELKAGIRTVLLEMDKNEEGQSALATFEKTAKFDEFPGGAETALTRMQELFDVVQTR